MPANTFKHGNCFAPIECTTTGLKSLGEELHWI